MPDAGLTAVEVDLNSPVLTITDQVLELQGSRVH